jgi:hypothetical protein
MTMGLEDDGDPTTGLTGTAVDAVEVDMDLEETTEAVVGKLMEKSRSTSLQNEVARSARTTPTTTTTTGMKKIEEEEEEEEILGMKTRSWKKINLSFAVELIGQEGEDIRRTDDFKEENNTKMKHHPIMSKIAYLIVAIEKNCNTVKIMSSKKLVHQ